MSRSAFVDTSGWYALIDRRDAAHARAKSVVQGLVKSGVRLVTSDYVLDESLTLTRMRAGGAAAVRLLDLVDQTAALDTEWIGADRFAFAKALFRKQVDQGFSFTDCTSFIVMEERGIREALTADSHYVARGFHALLIS
jgi:predicted nucleic acid-binding protein